MEALQERSAMCPYCGQQISLLLDCMQVGDSYVEDCSVCCQPIVVSLYSGEAGELEVQLVAENA
ncbi:CPXCG motif-containing cysteine-rich protein [Litorivivens sp.]|uniref:CPXCG motif-containing cysteine-rich protein n=1 Tax=Litorivivens sp. TaxID=2020868 RepID=UPI00356A6AFB